MPALYLLMNDHYQHDNIKIMSREEHKQLHRYRETTNPEDCLYTMNQRRQAKGLPAIERERGD